jgi:hypothetical protein
MVLMVIASLVTKHSPAETELPTLRATHADHPGLGKVGYLGWIVLAAVMVGLYLFFQLGM